MKTFSIILLLLFSLHALSEEKTSNDDKKVQLKINSQKDESANPLLYDTKKPKEITSEKSKVKVRQNCTDEKGTVFYPGDKDYEYCLNKTKDSSNKGNKGQVNKSGDGNKAGFAISIE